MSENNSNLPEVGFYSQEPTKNTLGNPQLSFDKIQVREVSENKNSGAGVIVSIRAESTDGQQIYMGWETLIQWNIFSKRFNRVFIGETE